MVETPGGANPAGTATPAAGQPTTPPTPPVDKGGVTPPAGAPKPADSQAPAQGAQTVPISALMEEREKRQSLQSEIEQLRAQISAPPSQPQQQQQPQQTQSYEQYQQEMDKLWESDPRKAVQAEIYTALTWRDNVEAQVDHQKVIVGQKYQDYNDYAGEVNAYLRTLPLQERARPGVVELAYYLVRGQKVDNIVDKTRAQIEEEMRRKFEAGNLTQGIPGGGIPGGTPEGGIQLTDDQRKAAMAMGMSEADYAKNIVRK